MDEQALIYTSARKGNKRMRAVRKHSKTCLLNSQLTTITEIRRTTKKLKLERQIKRLVHKKRQLPPPSQRAFKCTDNALFN